MSRIGSGKSIIEKAKLPLSAGKLLFSCLVIEPPNNRVMRHRSNSGKILQGLASHFPTTLSTEPVSNPFFHQETALSVFS